MIGTGRCRNTSKENMYYSLVFLFITVVVSLKKMLRCVSQWNQSHAPPTPWWQVSHHENRALLPRWSGVFPRLSRWLGSAPWLSNNCTIGHKKIWKHGISSEIKDILFGHSDHKLTNALIAIAGREMKRCPSLVICHTGVYVVLQEFPH